MTLDSWMYADPEKVAIRREEDALRKHRACGDCIHQSGIVFKGEVMRVCAFKRHVYGKRCDLYENRGQHDGISSQTK